MPIGKKTVKTLTAIAFFAGAVCIVLLGREYMASGLGLRMYSGGGSQGVVAEAVKDAARDFNWQEILLPPQTSVVSRLERGKDNGARRLQLLCTSPLPMQRISAFYETELAKAGWKKYNNKLPQGSGALSDMYRLGNLSLALQVFPADKGSHFRVSIVTVPLVKE